MRTSRKWLRSNYRLTDWRRAVHLPPPPPLTEERGERQRLPTHFTTILNDISSIIDNLYVSQSLPSYHPPTTTLKVYNHDLNFYKMVSEGLLTANTVVVYSFITSCAMSTFTLCLDYQHLHNRLQIQPHV